MRTIQKLKTLVFKLSTKKVDILSEDKPKDCVGDTSTKGSIEDTYKLYKLSENLSLIDDKEHELQKILFDRDTVVDRLVRKHRDLHLKPETLHLCICIFDKYISLDEITGREINLAGISAMFIACKYEERQGQVGIERLSVDYSIEEIVAMEKRIFERLDWKLTFPTPYMFMVCLLQIAPSPRSKVMENMAFFFGELGMGSFSTRKFCPSLIAASALYAARVILNEKPLWTEKLERTSDYCELQLMDTAQLLLSYSCSILYKRTEVHDKYTNPKLGCVALHRSADKKTFLMLKRRRRKLEKAWLDIV